MTPRSSQTLWIIAIEVVALIVCLAVPGLRAADEKKRIRQAVTDLETVRTAALAAQSESREWPDDAVTGQIPKGLEARLPAGFKFDHPDYRLDWDHWVLRSGAGETATSNDFAAVSIVARDPVFATGVTAALLPDRLHATLGNRLTVVLMAPGVMGP